MAFLQGDKEGPPPRKRIKGKGKVVVIGAGPAGLAAAMHLKVGMHSFLGKGISGTIL
jgi:NADPH-dependent glutamate synthase beta subunit-like oxidoreductase